MRARSAPDDRSETDDDKNSRKLGHELPLLLQTRLYRATLNENVSAKIERAGERILPVSSVDSIWRCEHASDGLRCRLSDDASSAAQDVALSVLSAGPAAKQLVVGPIYSLSRFPLGVTSYRKSKHRQRSHL